MQFECTLTDTFAGELNYSWVRRATIEAPEDASNTLLVRRAKRALGMAGIGCRTETWGDTLVLRWGKMCLALTIEPKYN